MKETQWNDFRRIDFDFMDRKAILIFPANEVENGRWILKTEYFDAFQGVDLFLVRRGYYLAYVSSESRWAPDSETEIKAAFCTYLHENFHLASKCIPLGLSCGGLQAAMLAIRHPEKVTALYLDAPVLNILSMAGLGECEASPTMWEELKNTYGFSKSTLINFRESPIDHLDILIKNSIPVLLLYGNADTTVIYSENGKVLEDYYKKNGGTIKIICRSMAGHHPHGLDDPSPIVAFLDKYGYKN